MRCYNHLADMPTFRKSSKHAESQVPEPFSLVPRQTQREMYAAILRARTLRGSATVAHNDVAEIAASMALRDSDPVVAPPSSIGAHVVRGNGNQSRGAGESFEAKLQTNLVTFATSEPSSLEVATAIASAHLAGGEKRVALVCCGTLGPETEWRSAIRFAGHHRLPIIYLVHSASASQQHKSKHPDLRTLYAEFGVPVITTDFADAVAIYRVTTEAAHNSRVHRGATVIEAMEMPLTRKSAERHDPLQLLEAYMRRHQAWTDEWRDSLS